jgi:ubiquitin carboxyl-terminal hydrolase 22/27/51
MQRLTDSLRFCCHATAVTCGPKAAVYCFKCGDYVYHEIFDQEKERLDIVEKLPSHAWNKTPIQRSFDPFRFLHIQDEGIIWKGMVATYPLLVPQDHVLAARLSRKRQILFEGEMEELSLLASPNAKAFAAWNSQKCK